MIPLPTKSKCSKSYRLELTYWGFVYPLFLIPVDNLVLIEIFLVPVPKSIFESTCFKKDFGSDSINFESRSATKNRVEIMDLGENEFRCFCFIRTRLVTRSSLIIYYSLVMTPDELGDLTFI